MTRALPVLPGLLGLVLAVLLLRNALGIGVPAPYDPNEGWNAIFATRAMAGLPLYPHGWLTDNYPPLSFYVVGALGRLTGDVIVAGRLVSLLSFLTVTAGICLAARQMGRTHGAALFAALFFAAVLLLASDYVAMDDPQLLAHAIQIAGLLLVLRRQPVASALLFAASLFVKHNLLALPLASAAFLLWEDRRLAARFIAAGLVAGIAGLAFFHALTGQSLLTQLASPRVLSFANFQVITLPFLAWAALPLLLVLVLGRRHRFVGCYLVTALLAGLAFAPGDGVDANIFFDAAIALSLGLAGVLDRLGPRHAAFAAIMALAPLLLVGARDFNDLNYGYTARFRAESAANIAFLRQHPGPALCQMLSLCHWADKTPAVDVFNTAEAIRTGALDDAPLARAIASQRFAVIQLDQNEPFALGPRVKAALTRAYRRDHADDNGSFFVPLRAARP